MLRRYVSNVIQDLGLVTAGTQTIRSSDYNAPMKISVVNSFWPNQNGHILEYINEEGCSVH